MPATCGAIIGTTTLPASVSASPSTSCCRPKLTGVESPIIVVFGDRFPMVTAHKVLAAYACLAPRIVTGQFDPTTQRAIWPSTGNYARGGIAISRIMASRGVAILPEGMSQERFDWLERWCENPADDIIRTFGTESNVKEIYDACNELARDPGNVVLNQFCEFGNHLAHYEVTGRALGHVFDTVTADRPGLRLAAFVSATGSAGTIAAGDRLKDDYGARIVAVEALECPTMLANGFGEHNIQGIGDKHIPLIHNVMNTDVVVAISDRATDQLQVMFASDDGLGYLADRRLVPQAVLGTLRHFGLSSICNVLAAISTAKLLGLGPDDAIITVATDGAAMYGSERDKIMARDFGGWFTNLDAAAVWGEHLADATTETRRRVHGRRSQPHLQPRVLHVGRAAGHPARAVRSSPRAVVLGRSAPLSQRLGRDDRRLQQGRRVVVGDATGAVLGWRCAVCAATVDVAVPHPFTCPRSTPTDRRHVLHPLVGAGGHRGVAIDDPNPLVAYGSRMAWWAFGAAHGMTERALIALAREVGEGFTVSPFTAHQLDLRRGAPRTVWVKDETGGVGGSHKSRHLAGILLHLRAAESLGLVSGGRAPLAIASCGNAALAAATLAQRASWPLRVFVPEWASPDVIALIESLDAAHRRLSAHATTIRRATRRSCDFARPSPTVPCRSRCRVRRMRCVSMPAARSGGRSPTPQGRLTDQPCSIGCSCRSAAEHSPPAWAGDWDPGLVSTRSRCKGAHRSPAPGGGRRMPATPPRNFRGGGPS